MTTTTPHHTEHVEFGGFGTRYLIRGEDTGGRFALVEHVLAPRILAAPMHSHEHEDECTYVLEGRIGVQIGDEVRIAGPGDVVFKPRGIPHAFWNAGDDEARCLEHISPGGFEHYFEELAPLLPPQQPAPDIPGLMATAARYGLTMDMESMGRLMAEHGLVGG